VLTWGKMLWWFSAAGCPSINRSVLCGLGIGVGPLCRNGRLFQLVRSVGALCVLNNVLRSKGTVLGVSWML
jgi:hypothetical protein